ncbi:major facilitator superfamily domain-containing protein [Phthorimaea operculella]|nr:major facilitator superfamily domain-containing protein [Phthorimaea operculella]
MDKTESEKKDNEEVSVDDILHILGPFGRFNILNFALILFPVFLAGMYSSVYNFESMDLNYRCSVPECEGDPLLANYSIPHDEEGNPYKCVRYATFSNETLNSSQCMAEYFDTSSEIECDSYVYLEEYSIVKEFNLACQDWKRTLVGTVHNAGFFLSIPLTGLMSDRLGRRMAVIFACVANGVFGVIRVLSVNYEMFVVFEFLEPAFGGGVYTACFVLALELVGPKGRVFTSLLFNTMFILGGVTVTLLSCKGKYEEGLEVLSKSERMNNVTVPKEHYDQIEKVARKQREARKYESSESNQSSFQQMFTSTMIWKRLFICSFLWICSTLVYYGLSINAIELSGNAYMNYIVVIAIEAPANVCKLMLLDRYGRKKVIAIAYFCTGLILCNYGFVPAGTWSIAVYLGGKFFITLAYNSLYVFAAEVFPTNYRTTLLAVCSTIGRIGSTVAPQTPLLTRYYEYLPTMLFGTMAALSGFLVLTLPETNNMKLPDSLKEAQEQDRRPQQSTEESSAEDKTRL